ncbi:MULTISPECIES: recombinase family protein [unclassified Corynebacterium]|uniref:recombinase family protein n=1 Tax=unclassified Corynebacterium TaxID=2624378 RepID=UPI0021103DD7|nr:MULTISPECIES: recombinase family protein [unclassified Corynebacterium]
MPPAPLPSHDYTTSKGRLPLGELVAAAEYERNLISERTVAGLQAAKSQGKRLGRPLHSHHAV